MIQFFELASIYILALIGLASIVVIAVALWLAFRYDITFTIRTGKDKKQQNQTKDK